jgi:anti-sigma-K factor RskA
MIDERREAQASLFVLGALPDDELREFESAMRADLELQLLVRELRDVGGAMTASFPRVAPPPDLRQRIMAAVDARETARARVISLETDRPVSWIAWMPWALAACFAILCVALISIGQSLRQQAVSLNDELGERNTEAAELRRQLDALQVRVDQQITNYQERLVEVQRQVTRRIEDFNRQTAAVTNQLRQQQAEAQRQMVIYRNQADQLSKEKKMLEEALTGLVPGGTERLSIARLAILRPTAGSPADVLGASVWSPADQRGLLVLENLPALPPSQSYQLWLFDPKLPAPMSGGVLPANASGSFRLQYSTQSRIESVERFAVSIEPRGGAAAPTGKIVFASH